MSTIIRLPGIGGPGETHWRTLWEKADPLGISLMGPFLRDRQAFKIISFEAGHCYFLMIVFHGISIARRRSVLKSRD